MYFAFGWPKVLGAIEPGARQEDVIYLYLDEDFFVLVSTSRIQLWTGGQHRVKLGSFFRDTDSISTEGLNRKAFWSSSKRSLAVLTYNNVLHVYGMHSSKEPVLSTSSTLGGPAEHVELKRVDIYLQQSQTLSNGGANASDLVGDSRSLLLGFSDSTMQLFSWQAKLRVTLAPFSPKEALRVEMKRSTLVARRPSLGERDRASERRAPAPIFHKGSQLGTTRSGQLGRTSSTLSRSSSTDRLSLNRQGSNEDDKPPPGIECMDYSSRLHLIAAVLTDGRCAILRAGAGSLAAGDKIEFSHSLCGPGMAATSVRMSAAAQLVALGLGTGEVALYRLWGTPDMEPLRLISLADWGYESEVTGSVAELQWSPDSRALAVGWRRSGLGLWSPAGCRLMCTLRQTGLRSQLSGPAYHQPAAQGLEGGISVMAWGVQGYRLMVAESGALAQVMELTLAKSLPNSHRVPQPEDAAASASRSAQELFFLLADDRVLQISDNDLLCGDFLSEPGTSSDAAATSTDLTVHHLKPPSQYVAANWPLQHAALSPDSVDIAVAGRRGLALYSRRSARWRLFGDVSHEKELTVHALLWLPRMVLVCATMAGTQSAAHLLLFPRYHLDNASILARFPLEQVPLAIDVLGAAIVVASPPLDISVLRVNLTGELTPLGTPTASFQVVRELSIMSAVVQPLQDIALVEVPSGAFGSPERPGNAGRPAKVSVPGHCVLLRAGGLLSVLDMEQGSELSLSDDIECFWLSGPSESSSSTAATESKHLAAALDMNTSLDTAPSRADFVTNVQGGTPSSSVSSSPRGPLPLDNLPVGPSNGLPPLRRQHSRQRFIDPDTLVRHDAGQTASTSGRGEVEIPWWTYGARGMQLWFPSCLTEPMSPNMELKARVVDPELEFDREVYPIGISLAEVAIIGVTQRVARSSATARSHVPASAHSRLPLFQVVPETQPVLPCLLRRLLQQGRAQEALVLASQHANAPHFARSLEWLLFTSLEINAELVPSPSKLHLGQRGEQGQQPKAVASGAGALLTAAANLLRQFPQFPEIVVSVARKTDAAMWKALFDAVGNASAILEVLLETGALQSSACCLLIVDRLEGARIAHALALRLIRVTVAEGRYDLAAELLRFIVPPGDDNMLVGLPRPAQRNGGAQQHPSQATSTTAQPQQRGWLASWFGRNEPRPAPGQAKLANGKDMAAKRNEGLYPPGSSEDRAAWISAWRLVGHHAWRLLDQGRLKAAAQLGHALMDAGASLPALLLACPEAAREGVPSPAACLAALHMAEREFPVASERWSLSDAALVHEAAKATCSYDWLIGLSLLLENSQVLGEVRRDQPALWAAFVDLAMVDSQAQPYMDIIAAVDAIPSPRVDGPRSLSPMPAVLTQH